MDNFLLENAIKYAERGWYVFPTREKEYIPKRDGKPIIKNKKGDILILKSKSPYFKGGFQNATKDINQIKTWWRKFPEAGIGVSCGHSGLVVVDIDIKGDGQGFENFLKMEIPDEGALHASTPSGGLHIIYSGNMSSHANVKAGVDIRSEGAYFLVPPSYIYYGSEKKSYLKLDDWERTPIVFPDNLKERYDFLRHNGERKPKKEYPHGTDIERVKKALDSLPTSYADDYFMWVRVGLTLKTLGDEGLPLWNEWSKKSDKYNEDDLLYKWEKLIPKDITIGTLFYYAKHAPKDEL